MQNPFETGHIKNYILLYASIVVIMVLFFIASTLFHDIEKIDKKVFDNNNTKFKEDNINKLKNIKISESSKFLLLDRKF